MKKGISLIVLVITIIVMIIIAGAIIISLTQTDMISKTDEAVKASNLANARSVVSLKFSTDMAKAEGPLSGVISTYADALKDELINAKLKVADLKDYKLTISYKTGSDSGTVNITFASENGDCIIPDDAPTDEVTISGVGLDDAKD